MRRGTALGLLAIGVVACGGSSSPSSSANANLFDPSQFNTSSVSWLAANQNVNGSSPPSSPTGTLSLAGSTDFSAALDPQAEYETIGFEFERIYTRQLVTYPASTNLQTANSIVPDAASSMPTVSSDGLTYTFNIKPGIMWNTSPPRAVTGQDFLLGLKRECDPTVAPNANPGYYKAEIAGYATYCNGFEAMDPSSTAAQRAAYINGNNISGITATNTSITFKLTAPSVDFLDILALPFASAAPVEDLNFVPLTPGDPIYSDGPYEIQGCTGTSTASGYNDCTGYNVGHSITWVPNPEWSASTDSIRHQYVAQINLKMDLSGSAASNEVQQDIVAGTTDLSFNTDVPTSDLASLSNYSDARFGSFPAPGTTNPYLVFNVQSNNNGGALKNVKVRQALEYAIDKVALTKIYGGPQFNQVLNQVIGPGAEGYVQFNDYPTPNDEGDPSTCKSMLASAGYPNGLTLKDYYRDSGNHPAIFQQVQSDFKACGVTVVGTPIATGYYGSKGIGVSGATMQAGDQELSAGQWDITEPGWVPDWFSTENGRAILPDLFDGAQNFPGTDWGGYDDPKVDNLVNQAEAAQQLSQAQNLWHQADEQVMADAPFIPFMTQLTNIMHSSRAHNDIWFPFSESYDLSQIWVSS